MMTEDGTEKTRMSDAVTGGARQSGEEDLEGLAVLLIEEDDLIRESLLDWLASVLVDARIVGRTLRDVEPAALRDRPAVVVVDIALIGGDGIDVVAGLHQTFPEAKIVALSMVDDEERCEAVLAAGAAACLPAWEVREKLESTLYELLGTT